MSDALLLSADEQASDHATTPLRDLAAAELVTFGQHRQEPTFVVYSRPYLL
jgi:hypothetical protein